MDLQGLWLVGTELALGITTALAIGRAIYEEDRRERKAALLFLALGVALLFLTAGPAWLPFYHTLPTLLLVATVVATGIAFLLVVSVCLMSLVVRD